MRRIGGTYPSEICRLVPFPKLPTFLQMHHAESVHAYGKRAYTHIYIRLSIRQTPEAVLCCQASGVDKYLRWQVRGAAVV